jgi:two-component system phosphate regulon sensor histidine kinase PhoR
MGNFDKYKHQLIESEHQQTIQALFKPGDYYFTMYFPRQQSMIFGQMAKWMLISALFLLIVIFSFWFTIVTIIRQKKLSEMKTDFINNMTHEFKTPIATISLASEMLMKPEVNQSTEKTMKYASVIYNENFRLQNQVEQVLQIAILDNGETKMRMKEVDIHKLIVKTVENFEIKAHEKSAILSMNFKAENPIIAGDRMHLSNVIANLIDNALKYSKENPKIELSSYSDKKGVTIVITDNGIGISPENQHLVFKNLYRVHTGDVHDVKGFGLGLYYVKQIVEMHRGAITLSSQLGIGSKFEIFLPYNSIQKEI